MLKTVPLLTIPVVIYNIVALAAPAFLGSNLMSLTLVSGAPWVLTGADILIIVALVILYFEILKSTITGNSALADHALSMVLFVVCLVEFLVFQFCGTSTFFIIMIMSAIDVIAGFSVTIKGARRDFGSGVNG